MLRPSVRLAAGTLVLALPLAAAAGCGAEKKRTIKAEFASAQANLEKSKAASFTLKLADTKGKLAASAKKDDATQKTIDAVIGGKVSITIDPAGAETLASLGGGKSDAATCATAADSLQKLDPADVAKQLKKVNLAISVSDDKSALGEIRLVEGALYVHVDLTEIGVLAKDNGIDDFDQQLDEFVDNADPRFVAGLKDVRAGKWLKLDVAKYLTQFQDLAKGFVESLSGDAQAQEDLSKACTDTQQVGKDLFAAVKPFVKVTDANNSSSNRVLDVTVQARPALKAALGVLKSATSLPFAKAIGSIEPSVIDDNVADGVAKGTITLKDGHLTQVKVDVDSIAKLDPNEKSDFAGTFVVLDVDDSASAVTTPTDVSSFDIGKILEEFLQGLDQGTEG